MPDPAPPTTPADASGDHLAHLHKMSTTAGVTNLDYVAVNQPAVVSLVFGVLSALAFFSLILLIVPVLGVAFGVVALRQVADSAGTQTGRALALAGLALSLALGGGAVARGLMASAATSGDQAQIAATLADLGKHLRAGDYAAAHALFDDEFRARVKLKQFGDAWKSVQAATPPGVGPIVVFEWNGVRPEFDSAGGNRLALAKARVKFERSNEERVNVVLRKAGDRWIVNAIPEFFPKPRNDGGGGGTFDLPDQF